MACCLTAPSHYLNQWWLLVSEFMWHSLENNFTVLMLLYIVESIADALQLWPCALIPHCLPPPALEPRILTRWEMQKYAREAYNMGIRYIGGCCGFEPYHIRGVAEELAPERGNKLPEACDKHIPWGGGLRMHTKPWVRARWGTLHCFDQGQSFGIIAISVDSLVPSITMAGGYTKENPC